MKGRKDLLRLIQKTGSINAAAKAMGIPYRKAWTYIDAMEKRLGFPLGSAGKGGPAEGNPYSARNRLPSWRNSTRCRRISTTW